MGGRIRLAVLGALSGLLLTGAVACGPDGEEVGPNNGGDDPVPCAEGALGSGCGPEPAPVDPDDSIEPVDPDDSIEPEPYKTCGPPYDLCPGRVPSVPPPNLDNYDWS